MKKQGNVIPSNQTPLFGWKVSDDNNMEPPVIVMEDNTVLIDAAGTLCDQCGKQSVQLKAINGCINGLDRWQDLPVNYPPHTRQNVLANKLWFNHRCRPWHTVHRRFTLRYTTHYSSLVTIRVRNGSFLYQVNKETQVTIKRINLLPISRFRRLKFLFKFIY